MKFRAVKWSHSFEAREPAGPWRRRYGAALADARSDVAPYKRAVWAVETSAGKVREISEQQHERGVAEYHDAIEHRDAVGVWG